MARKYSASQIRSKLRQAQSKQKQAIAKVNRSIREYNNKVRTATSKYNQAVNQYNSKVRAHNNRVRSNRNRLLQEINKLSRHTSKPSRSKFQLSVETVYTSYARLNSAAESNGYGDHFNEVLDLSEREAANSTSVMNSLLGDPEPIESENSIQSTNLEPVLSQIGLDLHARWKGALYSLNQNNPDAARHFCTSSREILTRIIDVYAPNNLVLVEMPDCDKTQSGIPTRRSKIRFFLVRGNMDEKPLEDFVEEDLENIVQLFQTFNDGTHGDVGRFSHDQLFAVKARVEHAIEYLWSIIPENLKDTISHEH